MIGLLPLMLLAAPAPNPASLAGIYDGGQMEIAAALELTKDGKFRYALSYGALDEMASGRWTAENGTVVLSVEQYQSNDPYAEERFGPSVLKIEDGDLTIPRHDRLLRFRKS